jgi:hypothetical protein
MKDEGADKQPSPNAANRSDSRGRFDGDIVAVRQALTEMAAGDHGVPLDEFDREFRAKHGLPLPRSQP